MKRLLRKSDFHAYQRRAIDHQVNNLRSLLWLFMGSGKTAVSLTTIDHFIQYQMIRAALVVGPLRVVQSVWEQEACKWEHTKHLRFNLLHGSTDRISSLLHQPADVYLINYEGLEKLCHLMHTYFINHGLPIPFQMLVIDESSKIKNPETLRFQSLSPLLPHFPYRTALTGSCAPNGLLDIFGQFLAIDDGERFGQSRDAFRSAYFRAGGYGGYTYVPTDEGKEIIYSLASEITLEMAQKDYIKLPDLIVKDIQVTLPPKSRSKYDELEILLFTELDCGKTLEVNNPLSKSNKLLQMANGAVYVNTESKDWRKLHDAKLDALEDILAEAEGNPVLLGYNYRTDAARIKKRFKFAVDLSDLSGKQFIKTIGDFQEGKIRLLMGHPASMGHGVDGLQKSCNNIVWFGVPWSLELYVQLIARVQRQGKQDKPTTCYRILATDTMDEAVAMKLGMKADTEKELREAVHNYREAKYGKGLAA